MVFTMAGCSAENMGETFDGLRETARQIKAAATEQGQEAEEEQELPQRNITEEEETLYYGYSCLEEEEKEVYRQIAAGIEAFQEEIPVTAVSTESLEKIVKLVMADHPEYFWTDGTCSFSYRELQSGEVTDLSICPEYQADREEAQQLKVQIETKADQWISQVPEGADTYEKIKFVYETLISQVHYRQDSPQNQNIRSVFLEGSTVCMGYAKATQYLLNRMGIFCTLVTGTAGEENISHAWNLVKIGSQYYYVDTTWGNPGYQNPEEEDLYISYSYLCCPDEEIQDTHTADGTIPLPSCTDDSYNYYRNKGCLFDVFDREALYQLLQRELEQGAEMTELKYATEDAYSEAVDALVHGSLIENAVQNSTALLPGTAYSWKTYYGTNDRLLVIVWR